jgi:5-methylcytosine-specific restriction protein B
LQRARSAALRDELEARFHEFGLWFAGRERESGAARWSALRAEARRQYAAVADMDRLGLDLGERALLALLPHTDGVEQRQRGAFCHVLPGLGRDLRRWFEDAGWTQPEHWPALARGLFLLVRRCDENPAELWQACGAFAALPGSRGFESGLVSPILNALRPDDFLLVNEATRAALNHYTGSAFGPGLTEYPEAQAALRRLLDVSRPVLLVHAPPGMRMPDCFALFSHWLMHEHLPAGTAPEVAAADARLDVPPGEAAAAMPATLSTPIPAPLSAPAATPVPMPALARAPAEAPALAFVTASAPEPAWTGAASLLDELCALARARGQLLLHGPPGGRSAAWAEAVASRLLAQDGERPAHAPVERLVFHAAWTYADFIQRVDAQGNRRAGHFTALCRRAAEHRGTSILLLHALQRADAGAVLGEALPLLELRERECALAGGGTLKVPAGLLLVASMETPEGEAPADAALAQRFACAAAPAHDPAPPSA